MPAVLALRARQQRNFLATLLLSQGTPMLLGGDEIGPDPARQQQRLVPGQRDLLVRLDRDAGEDAAARLHPPADPPAPEHPSFRRDTFLRGKEVKGSGLPDVWWFRADGLKMTRRDWQGGEHVLGMFLNGREIPTPGPRGEDVEDDSFVLLFNAHLEDRVFTLPRRRFGAQWALELSTADPEAEPGSERHGARTELAVVARSIVILKRVA